ncbi:hypothetical protein SDC9_107800 [bioreactor metagenome]|uniref:Uncharacterized protein n=1 Tax=bioreactor metagenome TaxID=1076179 RepID=A0A645B7B7_9ZZZZ
MLDAGNHLEISALVGAHRAIGAADEVRLERVEPVQRLQQRLNRLLLLGWKHLERERLAGA